MVLSTSITTYIQINHRRSSRAKGTYNNAISLLTEAPSSKPFTSAGFYQEGGARGTAGINLDRELPMTKLDDS